MRARVRDPLLIRGQWGLGDNIYARPFIRAAAERQEVYLETPWPDLYEDLPVKFVRGERNLRTQMKNVNRQAPARWVPPPRVAREIRLGYSGADLEHWGIVRTLESQVSLWGRPLVMDLPPMGRSPVRSGSKPVAVVRPVTVRREWRNEARNPRPEYVNMLAQDLMRTHHVVAVADLSDGQEWLVGGHPPAHRSLLSGQLDVRQLLALVAAADIVVGGVGWIVPAALALRTRTFVVLGGHGAHNAPEVLLDRRLDSSRIGFGVPARFCRCSQMMHSCDKEIPDLGSQFLSWVEETGRPCSTDVRATA